MNAMLESRPPLLLLLLSLIGSMALLVSGCGSELDGPSCASGKCDTGQGEFDLYQPGNRFGWGGEDEYLDEIQPILAKRCVACHGCTDSPCQLKLSSYEGLLRGSNTNNLFAPTVFAQDPSRLKDGRVDRNGIIDFGATEEEWRDSGYYSVVDSDPNKSLMTKLLTISREFSTQERDSELLTATHDLYTNTLEGRTFECVGAQEVSQQDTADLATRAMPFGLEPLEPGDFEKIVDWISRGAPGPSDNAQEVLLAPQNPREIREWEEFLNGKNGAELDLKRYLMARYLFEHMFFAHIRFEKSPGEFYEMVRSKTPTGTPIDEIVEEFIMNDPDQRVFYRFRKITAIMVRKTHTVWDLNASVMAHNDDLFLKGITDDAVLDYQVTEDPGYTHKLGDGARNPFRYFSQIPGQIRSQFMIENSKKLIESLVKADVCTGSTATYAIRDHFWVWFLKPSSDPSATNTDDVSEAFIGWNLNPFALHSILETHDESAYQEDLEKQMRLLHPNGLGLDDIWLGNGATEDPNSWLTILRHEKSATVEWGAVGGQPETAWLLSYTNFERLYYNLTVNFLYWQGALDQLETWTYFSNIRTEGEDLMLSLVPADQREAVRNEWTAGFDTSALFDAVGSFKEGRILSLEPADDLDIDGQGDSVRESQVTFEGFPSFAALAEKLDARRSFTPGYDDILNRSAVPGRSIADISTFTDFELGLDKLTGMPGDHARNLPNATVFRVSDAQGNRQFYTVISNRTYSSNDFAFGSSRARTCDDDYISAHRGIVGSYPELFVDLPLSRAAEFLRDVQDVKNVSVPAPGELNWLALANKYIIDGIVVTRYSKAFWPFVDDMHSFLSDPAVSEQSEAAILDLSEYAWFAGNNRFEDCGPL